MGIPFDHKENFLAGEDENLNVAKTNKQLSICLNLSFTIHSVMFMQFFCVLTHIINF